MKGDLQKHPLNWNSTKTETTFREWFSETTHVWNHSSKVKQSLQWFFTTTLGETPL